MDLSGAIDSADHFLNQLTVQCVGFNVPPFMRNVAIAGLLGEILEDDRITGIGFAAQLLYQCIKAGKKLYQACPEERRRHWWKVHKLAFLICVETDAQEVDRLGRELEALAAIEFE